MIPVQPQREPSDFDGKVRQPGLKWLEENHFDFDAPAPPGAKLPPYWRKCLDVLHEKYGGVCAYLCVYIERIGAETVAHYVAKSKLLKLAYEWSNYRLACRIMNGRKGTDKVLDPFEIKPDTFRLELVTGRIYVNPESPGAQHQTAKKTIDLLGLDLTNPRKIRSAYWDDFIKKEITAGYLKKKSPFVWLEANRQGLL